MDEEKLLAEALGLTGRLISREPFGAGAIAGFLVDDDGESLTYYVDTSGEPVDAETGMVLREGERIIARVWLHPADPRLPTLPVAAFAASAGVLLERCGIRGSFEPEIVAYRPGKRAVVRLRGEGTEHYLKVVPPAASAKIAALHDAVAHVGAPAVGIRGWASEGCMLIEPAIGVGGLDAAVTMPAAALLDAVDDARGVLERASVPHAARASLALRASWYASRLARVAPALEAAAERIREAAPATPPDAVRFVHGDLHLGQLFFRGGAVSGVIDLDTAGMGDPADDVASFIAHTIASSVLNAETSNAVAAEALVRVADAAADRWLDSRSAAICAVHLLAHALAAAESGHAARATRLTDCALGMLDR